MKKGKHRLITISILFTLATGLIHIINKIISASALIKDILDKDSGINYYKWRFGNMFYTKSGHGKPILLIHDITSGSSGYEWNKIEDQLSQQYTVYTIDLLGCGRSDKPKITYTNYIYVELICDFVEKIICEPTNIIASGLSGSVAIMACHSRNELFDHLMLVNPTNLAKLSRIPTNNSRILKFIFEIPVFGTMLYHILTSRIKIESLFMEDYYYNPFKINRDYMDAYYEASHMKRSNGKYLASSLSGNYLYLNILHGLTAVNNSISIIGGQNEPGINDIIEDYTHFNPAIESYIINKTKHFPHMEDTEKFLEQIGIFIN